MSTAWLVIADSENRISVGNEGYRDEPSQCYVWNDTVPRAREIAVGDTLVLRSKKTLLGTGVIDRIDKHPDEFTRKRCPACKGTDVRLRKVKRPEYKCGTNTCLSEFGEDQVIAETVKVVEYKASYDASWVGLFGRVDAQRLRKCCLSPKTQHSITEIDWAKFLSLLSDEDQRIANILASPKSPKAGGRHGHSQRSVRVRIGQQAFRAKLRKQFSDTCAITGPMPSEVLDAAHLYSYATEGVHHDDGGILLRKDVHRLFDLGYICVNTKSGKIDVLASVRGFLDYEKLHNGALQVPLAPRARRWLELHWNQWREPSAGTQI